MGALIAFVGAYPGAVRVAGIAGIIFVVIGMAYVSGRDDGRQAVEQRNAKAQEDLEDRVGRGHQDVDECELAGGQWDVSTGRCI